jgi:plasmid stabilization system protein ParE
MEDYKVELTEHAEDDLRTIIRYISVQLSAPTTALKMIETIEKALGGLSVMPQSQPLVQDDRLASMGYRKLVIGNHIAFFSIDERKKIVDVERILYARRDWIRIL